MGAFGSGLASGVDSVNQLRQQHKHNEFMTGLMQQMIGNKGGGNAIAPVMEGPMQGPQVPQGGISLQNMMMSKLRGLPIAQLLGGL